MEITTFDKLSKEDQALVKTAMEARENAYTPYSNHKVGSAVRTANGKVFPAAMLK